MTTIEINSRELGTCVFTVATDGGYVRLNGEQVCEGGRVRGGSTLYASGSTLKRVATAWVKAYDKSAA